MRILASLALALVYLAMVGSIAPADAATGLAVGAGAAYRGGRAAPLDRRALRRLAALPWFLLGLLLAIGRGSGRMLVVLARGSGARDVGDVELPFGDRSPRAAAVAALIASATPGSVLVRIDHERRVVVLNVIDARDPDAVRAELDAFHRRYQRHVLP